MNSSLKTGENLSINCAASISKKLSNSNIQKLESLSNNAQSLLAKKVTDCAFCQKTSSCPHASPSTPNENYYHCFMNKILYSKYSSSQNYYYTKDLNEIIANNRCSSLIKLKDNNCFDDVDEYFKRFYKFSEYSTKNKMLSEYYKFHKDIPRLFMLPTTNVLNKFYDRKRRVEYVKITRLLKQDDKDVKESAGNEYLKYKGMDDFEYNQAAWCRKDRYTKDQHESKPNHYLMDHAGPTHHASTKRHEEISCSNTIHDLNQKLGEIISSNSRVFDLNENESFTNAQLNNFINFLKHNDSNFTANNTIHQTSQLHISLTNPTQQKKVVTQTTNTAKSKNIATKKNTEQIGMRPNILLPSSYNYKKNNDILQDLKVSEEKKFSSPGTSQRHPQMQINCAFDSPVHSPLLKKDKIEFVNNKNPISKKKTVPDVIAPIGSTDHNEHGKKLNGPGIFTRKISLDENFIGQNIKLGIDAKFNQAQKVSPIVPFGKNSNQLNDVIPNATTHSSEKDIGDSPVIPQKIEPQLKTNSGNQNPNKKKVISNNMPPSVSTTSDAQSMDTTLKKTPPKEKIKVGSDLKSSGVTFAQSSVNTNNNHMKMSNIYKKKLSNPGISSKDINTLNSASNSSNLKTKLISSLVNFESKQTPNNSAKTSNQISKSGSSKNMANIQEKSPTMKKIPEPSSHRVKITQPSKQQMNPNVQNSKFAMNARHASLGINQNNQQHFNNTGTSDNNTNNSSNNTTNNSKNIKSSVKESPTTISSYSKNLKSSLAPTLSETSEPQQRNKTCNTADTSGNTQQKQSVVPKINNFLNERSNSTTNEPVGTINSSRRVQGNVKIKPDQIDQIMLKEFLGVVRKSANNIDANGQIQKLIKSKGAQPKQPANDKKQINDHDAQAIRDADKIKKTLTSKNPVKKIGPSNCVSDQKSQEGLRMSQGINTGSLLLQKSDGIGFAKKSLTESQHLVKGNNKVSDNINQDKNIGKFQKNSPLKFNGSHESSKKI